jgi:hypothetical protein
MPTYDKRTQELKDRFTTIQGFLLFAETTRMMTALDTYYKRRDEVLTDLAFAATDPGDDRRRDAYESKLDSGGKELCALLNNMLDGVTEPTAEALKFRAQAAVEEAQFFATLAPLKLGTVHDDLQLLTENMEGEHRLLNSKWESETGAGKQLLEVERNAALEMKKIIQESIEKGVSAKDRVGKTVVGISEALASARKDIQVFAVDLGTKAGLDKDNLAATVAVVDKYVAGKLTALLGLLGKELADGLADWVKVYGAFLQDDYYSRVREYQSRIPNQGAVIVTFTTTRQEADKFIRENGMEVARKKHADTDAGLDSWAAGQMTDGLRSDAAAFGQYVIEGLAKRVDEMYGFFTTLVSKFEGIFLGSLGSAVEEELLAPRAWQDIEASIIGLSLDEKLRLWRGGLQELRVGMEDAWKQLQANLAELPAEVQTAIRDKVEALRADLLDKSKAATEELGRALDVTEKAAGSEQVKKVLDRRPLAAALRA